jgi:predicted nucleotidyltransferase
VSDPLVEQRHTYVEALARALKTAVRELSRLPEVEKVVLFGSYRRGRRDLFTDLDLLVVMRSFEGFVARMEHLYELLAGKMGVDYDLVAYTPEEIATYGETPFLKRALAEGKVVYEKRGRGPSGMCYP